MKAEATGPNTPRTPTLKQAVASGVESCGKITFISIAALALLAAVPLAVIGGFMWKNAPAGSRDLALGKLLVGLGVGLGAGVGIPGCLCTMVCVAKQGAGGG